MYFARNSYKLMVRCWDFDPNRRPTFVELANSVADIIANMRAAAEHRVSLKVAYINVGSGVQSEADSAPTGTSSPVVEDYLRPHVSSSVPMYDNPKPPTETAPRNDVDCSKKAHVVIDDPTSSECGQLDGVPGSTEYKWTPADSVWTRREIGASLAETESVGSYEIHEL